MNHSIQGRIIPVAALLVLSTPLMAQQPMPAAGGEDHAGPAHVQAIDDGLERPEGPRGEAAEFFQPGEVSAGTPRAPRGDSRSYSLTVAGNELSTGVDLPLSAPGAVMRIQALGQAPVLHPEQLMLSQGDRLLAPEQALVDPAGPGVLADRLPGDAPGLSAFRAGPAVGPGTLTLQLADRVMSPGERYLVQVFEPESSVVAEAGTDSPFQTAGDWLPFEADLLGGEDSEVSEVEAVLVSPDGEHYPVSASVDSDGRVTGLERLPLGASSSRGLWELALQLEGEADGLKVRRDVRFAFERHLPTARLGDSLSPRLGDDALALAVTVEVGSPGRYELRAGLDGVGMAHTARWLEPGEHELVLEWPLGAAPLGRSLDVKDLRLMDQTRMSVLGTRAEALQLPVNPVVPEVPDLTPQTGSESPTQAVEEEAAVEAGSADAPRSENPEQGEISER